MSTILNFRPQSACAALAILLSAGAPGAGQSITDLSALPGASGSWATAVSGDGSTVVGYSGADPWSHRAFRWTRAGGMQELSPLPGHDLSTAHAISADGVIVGGGSGSAPGSLQTAVLWSTAVGVRDLGPGWVTGLSADGSVASGTKRTGRSSQVAWLWSDGGGIHELKEAMSTAAAAISADGAVITGVGWLPLAGGSSGNAFRWTAAGGGLETISSESAAAYDISADGSAIVGCLSCCCYGGAEPRAFRWTAAGGVEELGALPGHDDSLALAISGDGLMVAGRHGWATAALAVLWIDPTTPVNLNIYLPTLGIDLTGWKLYEVTGLSHDGTVLVGNGTYEGQPRAWIVDLNSLCYADCDRSGALDFFDFLCFQSQFAAGDPQADCDGSGALDFFDFLCFQNAFSAGCP